jgi:hypothetical protein
VQVEFEKGSSTVNKSENTSPADASLQRMRSELKDLLALSAGSRDVLPHLATLERALKTLGVAAFEGLPSFVLKQAAAQLEKVLPQGAGPGLSEVRARMAKALAAHEKAQAPAPAVAKPPAYVNDEKLQVSESTVTEFMRVVEASERKF